MDSKMLRGKRALVTGSVQGIGLAVALELAEAGAEVLLQSSNRRCRHGLSCSVVTGTPAFATCCEKSNRAAGLPSRRRSAAQWWGCVT
jgi:NAD(P)-dependent dehydrogenase (short-subunit alcohol dehydrogenase family)